jgi:hypothetical protein
MVIFVPFDQFNERGNLKEYWRRWRHLKELRSKKDKRKLGSQFKWNGMELERREEGISF